jgi:bacillithiol system protein YtxJ
LFPDSLNWINLTEENQLQYLIVQSNTTPQIIFKHSTRCNISSVALQRLKTNSNDSTPGIYYLDLIKYRSLSNKIAEVFGEHHESPQVLLIKNGECIYAESHLGITMKELIEQAITP